MEDKEIEIWQLEATIAFGADHIAGTWEVSADSDGTHHITVDHRTADGKEMQWTIPFDLSQTQPSASGQQGLRTLAALLDTSNLEGVEIIRAPSPPPSLE